MNFDQYFLSVELKKYLDHLIFFLSAGQPLSISRTWEGYIKLVYEYSEPCQLHRTVEYAFVSRKGGKLLCASVNEILGDYFGIGATLLTCDARQWHKFLLVHIFRLCDTLLSYQNSMKPYCSILYTRHYCKVGIVEDLLQLRFVGVGYLD